MKFLVEGFYFERLGDGFVYRPTNFSAGYSVSTEEKERLLGALKRLELRFLIEGLTLIVLIGGLFLTGSVTSPTPIPWFILLSISAVLLLAPTAFYRKRRIVKRILGGRTPDVPRIPLRQALMQPRPVIAKRYTIPILKSLVGLFILATVVVDIFALSPIIAALFPGQFIAGRTDSEAVAQALTHTLYNANYWLVFAAINVVLLTCGRLIYLEMKRIRALPDMNDVDSDGATS
jgi:hypothetical protein